MKEIAKKIKETNYKTIYVCATPYHILISMVLIMSTQAHNSSCIVMCATNTENYFYYCKLSKWMNINGIKNVVTRYIKWQRLIGLSDILNTNAINKTLKQQDQLLMVNFQWSTDRIFYPACLWFKRCEKAIFIEDGSTMYTAPTKSKFTNFGRKLYGQQFHFWLDHKVEAIYVQKPDKFPNYLIPYLTKFALDIDLTRAQKEKILWLFTNEAERREIEKVRENAGGIVFTQCFSEDGFMREEEKLDLYTRLCQFYTQYGKVYLKVHPRDNTDYQIEGVEVLEGSYPSEIFAMMGIKFDFAIGICTSAIETVNAGIKMNLNEKFLKEFKCEMKPIYNNVRKTNSLNIMPSLNSSGGGNRRQIEKPMASISRLEAAA